MRRLVLALAASLAAVAPALAQTPPTLGLTTAGQGSAFLPYGEGIARVVNPTGVAVIEVRRTGGSNDNLRAVDAEPATLGTVFLGSAFEALNGQGVFAGRRHENVRALFPMYETSFQVAALTRSGIRSVRDLAGKRVGTGPAAGPAEGFFRGLVAEAGIAVTIVPGQPADLVRQLIAGEIDALWQGAVVPIPSLVQVLEGADAIVFGLTDAEVAAMRRRFPFMAEATLAPGTYRGQAAPIRSVAAWNFVVAHKDLPEPVAHALTRAVLSAQGLTTTIGPAAAGTRAANAVTNTVVPFHPGAVRALAELGVTVR